MAACATRLDINYRPIAISLTRLPPIDTVDYGLVKISSLHIWIVSVSPFTRLQKCFHMVDGYFWCYLKDSIEQKMFLPRTQVTRCWICAMMLMKDTSCFLIYSVTAILQEYSITLPLLSYTYQWWCSRWALGIYQRILLPADHSWDISTNRRPHNDLVC